jgi:hypothetical protein
MSCDAVTYIARQCVYHVAFISGVVVETHQIHKPTQYNTSIIANLQECQQTDQQHNPNTINRYTISRRPCEDLWCFALQRQSEQTATCTVDIAVAGGESASQNHCIDNMRQDLDA